ncbi:DUF262 domain-containing protein [Comamonas terrigena]|uniref:DUF262 domain-containing protein n=1 Tax=Comamonas terrigena TaxID=32013 RepID=UPI002899480A|nr:DUF262 domain-containing protein [Comamonas terrigena]
MSTQGSLQVPPDPNAIDNEIENQQRVTDYEIREWPIEVLVHKFTDGLKEDNAELFIPDYQREFVWTALQQSRFIESLFMRLPIPYVFTADVADGPRAGNFEIIDGSQRIRTLVAFLQNRLTLTGLSKITSANGAKFEDLSKPRQLRFKRQTIRVIEMTNRADEETRREIFDRLNSGGSKLVPMEIRLGTQDGEFLQKVIKPCAELHEFTTLCPLSERSKNRKEHFEFVLRFFAYSDNYNNFNKSVASFLQDYLADQNKVADDNKYAAKVDSFNRMLAFVKQYFPNGFRRTSNHTTVPRIRFEAISVGVSLALAKQKNLVPVDMSWLESEEFMTLTRSDASNSKPRVVNRIHFVRDHLLGVPVEYHKKTKEVEVSENEDSPDESIAQFTLSF